MHRSSPKAEVTGSNPVGCAKDLNIFNRLKLNLFQAT
jgi:hypothetical protein